MRNQFFATRALPSLLVFPSFCVEYLKVGKQGWSGVSFTIHNNENEKAATLF